MLSGTGFCDELITRPEESYRLWCVVVCDLENFKNEEAMTRVKSQRHRKKSLANHHDGYVIKEEEMSEACGRCDRKDKWIQN